jgi:hypothetical protein
MQELAEMSSAMKNRRGRGVHCILTYRIKAIRGGKRVSLGFVELHALNLFLLESLYVSARRDFEAIQYTRI